MLSTLAVGSRQAFGLCCRDVLDRFILAVLWIVESFEPKATSCSC